MSRFWPRWTRHCRPRLCDPSKRPRTPCRQLTSKPSMPSQMTRTPPVAPRSHCSQPFAVSPSRILPVQTGSASPTSRAWCRRCTDTPIRTLCPLHSPGVCYSGSLRSFVKTRWSSSRQCGPTGPSAQHCRPLHSDTRLHLSSRTLSERISRWSSRRSWSPSPRRREKCGTPLSPCSRSSTAVLATRLRATTL